MIKQKLLAALGIDPSNSVSLKCLSEKTNIPISKLKYYNASGKIPTDQELRAICAVSGKSEFEIMLGMGLINNNLIEALQKNASSVASVLNDNPLTEVNDKRSTYELSFETDLGSLYQGDCLELLRDMNNESIDLMFADPPFNLNKLYPSQIDDDKKEEEYLKWCEQWLEESIRVLNFGGSLFVWNLPKWNTSLSNFLNDRLTFRHWISVDIKYSLPIQSRLYPSHYSLLYYCKGDKPNAFHPDRIPMQVCPKCKADLRDYGGYKDKMNPKGVNLTDVWYDIPPVRHAKYKKRAGANELSIKLMDRIIEMSSDEGDTVFDPFGGAGTTYVTAEIKNRKWIGIEIGPLDDIINRFHQIESEQKILADYRRNLNCLFTSDTLKKRKQKGLWTSETVRQRKQWQQQANSPEKQMDLDII